MQNHAAALIATGEKSISLPWQTSARKKKRARRRIQKSYLPARKTYISYGEHMFAWAYHVRHQDAVGRGSSAEAEAQIKDCADAI